MHRFSYLIEGCVAFMSSRLEQTRAEIHSLMEQHATSVHIKNLQSLNLQYAVTAVGIFSMFEADMQHQLEVDHGFKGVRALLKECDELDLLERFEVFALAINVLKHGNGRSYDELCKKESDLPFALRAPDENFFEEGDATEIDTLVMADEQFVHDCAELVHRISDIAFDKKYSK